MLCKDFDIAEKMKKSRQATLQRTWEHPELTEMSERMHAQGIAPNLFLVGAQKCGTTTLASLIAKHSDVFFSRIKEPNFLSFVVRPAEFTGDFKKLHIEDENAALKRSCTEDVLYAYIENPAIYQALFEGSSQFSIRAEGSVTYLFSSEAPSAIATLFPSSKILVILRDPVKRAISNYRMQFQAGVETEPDVFKAIMNDHAKASYTWGTKHFYVESGRYADQLVSYFDLFPKSQIHIAFFEELFGKKDEVANANLAAILGLDEFKPEEDAQKNASLKPCNAVINKLLFKSGLKRQIQRYVPKSLKDFGKTLFYEEGSSRLDQGEMEQLQDLFQSDRDKLENLLGRPAPW